MRCLRDQKIIQYRFQTRSSQPGFSEKGTDLFTSHRPLLADSVEKVGISGCKKATLALVSEPGHHVAWLSGSALIVAAG